MHRKRKSFVYLLYTNIFNAATAPIYSFKSQHYCYSHLAWKSKQTDRLCVAVKVFLPLMITTPELSSVDPPLQCFSRFIFSQLPQMWSWGSWDHRDHIPMADARRAVMSKIVKNSLLSSSTPSVSLFMLTSLPPAPVESVIVTTGLRPPPVEPVS